MRLSNAAFWPSYISNGSGSLADGEAVGFTNLAITYTAISGERDADAGAKCDFFGNNGRIVMN